MKYYDGFRVKCEGSKVLNKCAVCGYESLVHKLREDNKYVCLSCWNKDENAEIIKTIEKEKEIK